MTKFQLNYLPLPVIPDELLQEIFLRSSANVVGRYSLFIVNATSGEEVHVQQPFGVGIHGWFRIVGVSNGNICFKFSRDQDNTRFLVWNPTSQCAREIFDPQKDHDRSYFPVYGFGHVPNTDAYSIIHMCKRDIADAYVFFSRYCSRCSTWFHCVNCLPGVEKINPNSVFHNGQAYWITSTGDSYATPKSVLCYSVQDESFNEERELLINSRYRELVLIEYDIEHGTRNLLVRRAWRDLGIPHPITVRSIQGKHAIQTKIEQGFKTTIVDTTTVFDDGTT
ncbi:hypothetical protein Ahy_A01g002356 [Arachis hypogaea]|uniref:F-box associated beta-propeller type 1 domain-containing protein n=1 Tax=Arachis hypogaea TaxID=3818 RepID=A0A445EQJ8_ARAHY|nr:hypothetical protein Ahy_A01g002356 [Arachis hypogaea]